MECIAFIIHTSDGSFCGIFKSCQFIYENRFDSMVNVTMIDHMQSDGDALDDSAN